MSCSIKKIDINSINQSTLVFSSEAEKGSIEKFIAQENCICIISAPGDMDIISSGVPATDLRVIVERIKSRVEGEYLLPDPIGNPIKAICEDLELPDDQLLSALNEHLNIDNFITFWALETLLASSDGYCANRNNFFIYFDPNDNNRATFIPWGLDHYGWENTFEVYVSAELPRRLSRIDETATKFNNEMQRLLDDVWDEALFIGFINNASFLIENAQDDPDYQEKLNKFNNWVLSRKGVIESLLIDGITKGHNESSSRCTN